jgi:hypothetical protein
MSMYNHIFDIVMYHKVGILFIRLFSTFLSSFIVVINIILQSFNDKSDHTFYFACLQVIDHKLFFLLSFKEKFLEEITSFFGVFTHQSEV